jgi:ABC-type multidrug transport system fused ATPase/permease subunit
MFDNPISSLAKKAWNFSAGNRPRVVLFVIFFIIANIISLLEPLIVAKILNTVQEHGISQENFHTYLFLISLFIIQTVAFWIFHGPARVIETTNAFLVRANYKQYLLRGTLSLPLDWHTDHHSGDTIDKIEKGSKAIYDFSENGFQFIQAIVRFIGSLVALALFDFNTLFVILFTTFIAIRIIIRFDRAIVPKYRELNAFENKISAKIYDGISNISTIIILRVEALLESDLAKNIFHPLELFVRTAKLNEWKWFMASIASSTTSFFVLAIYAWSAIRSGEVILIGTLYALYSYTERINSIFYTFAYLYSDTVRWRTSIENAEELSRYFRKQSSRKRHAHHDWKICSIEQLRFSYHKKSSKDLHLDDISLRFRRGEKIAVIGESGSGKTTFLKILRGLYDPSSVSVSLDTRVLPSGFRSLQDDIALIPQDPEVFATTIRENITMGIDRTDEEIRRYTDLARCTDTITRLPHGLESSIVEKGVNLSGGEKQRLALARGLMASEDKSIILLDESTSSVDTHNENAIYENIFSSYPAKTIIASIHRLHLLQMFDTIYLFDRGKIIGAGNFDELLATSPLFAAMWMKYSKTRKK